MLIWEPNGSDSPVGPQGWELTTLVGICDDGMKRLGIV